MSSPAAASPPPGSYWNGMDGEGPDSATAVLKAVRDFRRVDVAMRRRTQAALEVNETDLLAIRHLIRAERAGESIGPTELSARLGITSAATAKLLSRLASTGHISREPHAVDRRAQVVHATPRAHREVKRALGGVHQRMIDVADELSVADRRAVIRFLRNMGAAMTEDEPPSTS
ncbi:MarR family winged helix-turn-helix transcriptional regulator [Cryobacterium fucosi]|uniref:MarR family transcriptional regulator n=1 Tax=Cryobacterium fucosi TaxID=1259157 RepID=A0A4R9AXV4_9MICO|nr:MarR family transcriptional regulator [Cryobacterium fucosi]TFD72115.1 MarR family transcriptional regulator [Cryobacterium fucosi]